MRMNSFLVVFCLAQAISLVILAFHDWVHVPPLTDIRALEKHHSKGERLFGSILNVSLVSVPLIGCLYSYPGPIPFLIKIVALVGYGLLTTGTIMAWWIPYIFGSSQEHKAGFAEYASTHHFLPKRGDHVIPNTLHVILHFFIWSCFGMALYALMR